MDAANNNFTYPAISIITAVLNDSLKIEDTLKSVACQDYPSVEHVIIDGGSTDGTLDIAKRYSGSKSRLISGKDRGVYDAMNRGIELSTGDWLFFLNSGDVFYDSSVLSNVAKHMHKRYDLIYGNVMLYNPDNDTASIRKNKRFSRFSLLRRTISHQAVFFNRSLFNELGGYDLTYPIKSDYELILRYYFSGGRSVKRIKRIITRYLLGGISDNAVMDRKEKMEIVRRYFSIFEYLFIVGENARAVIRDYYNR